ncbi:hypothetical protein M0R89_00195 [Halorussus limi]|uniref:DUF7344 domain-containing protein n=1 Tax=Halorussus limi TaxID=2938695 RepID=A0A8U0HUY6_9EURY|nr:hypothetical protein [Halorussus limi]UPV74506.1 hypothetical protein M0R89_00195 [Halorussus limi]
MVSDRNRRRSKTGASRSRERLVAATVGSRRRRYALYYLHEQSGPVPVEEVARQVAAWERTTTPEEVAPERTASVAASLRRRHVPALVECDLVAYDDRRRDRVVGRVTDPTVELLLANDPRTRVAWYKVYLAVTAISAGLLALVRFGVPPFAEVGSVAVAALVVALFAVASLGHWYDVYRWRRANEDMPPDFRVTLGEEVTYRDPQAESDESEDEEGDGSEDEDGDGSEDGESAGGNRTDDAVDGETTDDRDG